MSSLPNLGCSEGEALNTDFNQNDNFASMADLLAMTSCTTDVDVSANGKMAGGLTGVSAEASLNASYSKSGCEAVNAFAGTLQSAQKTTNCIYQKTYNYSAATQSITQTVSIIVGAGGVVNGNIISRQYVKANMIGRNEFNATAKVETETALESMLAAISEQSNDTKTQFPVAGDPQKNAAVVDEGIQQIVANNAIQDIMNEIQNNQITVNEVEYVILGTVNGDVIVDQQAQVYLVAVTLTRSLMDVFFKTDSVAEAIAVFKQENVNEAGGFSQILDSFFDGLTGLYSAIITPIIIAIAVVVGIVVLVIGKKALGGGGQGGIDTAKAKKMAQIGLGVGIVTAIVGVLALVGGIGGSSTGFIIAGVVILLIGGAMITVAALALKKIKAGGGGGGGGTDQKKQQLAPLLSKQQGPAPPAGQNRPPQRGPPPPAGQNRQLPVARQLPTR
jgi:hypothetical protein